jgi:hypothetical protein
MGWRIEMGWFTEAKRPPMERPPKEPTTAECAGCGHIVAKHRMRAVAVTDSSGYHYPIMTTNYYYCDSCQKPYDERYILYANLGQRYWKRMEVDEFGKPLYPEK